MADSRSLGISPQLEQYVSEHSNPSTDPIAAALAARTIERFGDLSRMNIGQDQGRLLAWLVDLVDARTVVEVGTFTGMSALWMARALPADGRMLCFDITDRFLPTAREAWEAAGVADRVEVIIGLAADGLARLPAERHIDLAFIDADKTGYQTYLDLLLPRLSPRGLIVVDNVLWGGAVVDPGNTEADTEAIRAFNAALAGRTDCEAVMLPIGDGITLVRLPRTR